MKIYKSGKLRGEKIKYKDGIGYSVWYPIPDSEYCGVCFNIEGSDLNDLIVLLEKLKVAKADKYKEEK